MSKRFLLESAKLKLKVNLSSVDVFSPFLQRLQIEMTQAEPHQGRHNYYQKYAKSSKTELIDEIARLTEQVRAKDDEISLLKKKLALYRSLK